ncbi:MAG: hypothetical protein ACRDD8_05620, partial [Bacteroidales bacterium]
DIKPGPVPETGKPNEPDKEQAGNEADTTPPTEAELKSYFNINTDLNVYQCLQQIKESTEEKDIQGRKLRVTASNVVSRNDEDGSFVSAVSGTVDGKDFSVEFACKGLKKKPARFYMATRVNASWKEGIASPESLPIPFDEFYRLKKSDKFTAEFLSQWVHFYSTSPGGSDLYDFTDEDIAKMELSDVEYDNGKISFVLTYDGIRGNDSYKGRPNLNFDKNDYYKSRIKLTDEPKYYYMQGVYQNLESFYGSFIELEDDKVFVAELVPDSKRYDNTKDIVTCTLTLSTFNNSNEELARFEYEFKGFKPLTDLQKEWVVSTKEELNSYMSKRFASAADGDVSEQMQRYAVSYWMKLAKMEVRRNSRLLELYCDKATQNNIEVDAWIPVSRRVLHSDILLIAPHFEVLSAQKKGNVLTVTVAMKYVNEVSIDGVKATFDIVL